MYREGSKLALVYAVFVKDGIEAAFKHGIDIIGLSPSTLKIQSKRWGGGFVAPRVAKVKGAPSAPRVIHSTKPRFTFGKKGKREMIMVHEGPQQSIIRFLDSGEEQCIVNTWLHPVKAAT